MMDGKRDVFFSFSHLLYRLADGKVSQEALDTGLYCFQSMREHVFDVNNYNVMMYESKQEFLRTILVKQIHPAVLQAEQEGRILWRKAQDSAVTFEEIDELLRTHGLDAAIRPVNREDYRKYFFQHRFHTALLRTMYDETLLTIWW